MQLTLFKISNAQKLILSAALLLGSYASALACVQTIEPASMVHCFWYQVVGCDGEPLTLITYNRCNNTRTVTALSVELAF